MCLHHLHSCRIVATRVSFTRTHTFSRKQWLFTFRPPWYISNEILLCALQEQKNKKKTKCS